MSDATEEKEESKPSALTNLIESISGSEKEEKSSTGATLPIALILLGVVVIGFAVLGIMLVMARRKAARLAAQVRKLEEEKEQAAEDQKLAENDETRDQAHKKVGELQGKIEALNNRLSDLKTMNAERAKTLSGITDWSDFEVVDRRGEG